MPDAGNIADTAQAAPGQHSKQLQSPQQQQPQQRSQEDNRKTILTPAPNPDNITAAQPRKTPSWFRPCNREPGRRAITWFSGYDGFTEAAVVHEPKWQIVGGTEDVLSDKGRRIETLWEDNNPGGRILGHHDEVQQKLRDGTLQLGHVDLHVITYPCWVMPIVTPRDAAKEAKRACPRCRGECTELCRCLRHLGAASAAAGSVPVPREAQ